MRIYNCIQVDYSFHVMKMCDDSTENTKLPYVVFTIGIYSVQGRITIFNKELLNKVIKIYTDEWKNIKK